MYTRDYPKTLGTIVRDYIVDLEVENQFRSEGGEARDLEVKILKRCIFHFIKPICESIICGR